MTPPPGRRRSPSTGNGKNWPSPIGEAGYHGPLGAYVREIKLQTEGDPSAVLVQVLTCFGNAAGINPHFRISATEHGTNIFAVIVGDSATARKGTSLDAAFEPFKKADPQWADNNNGDGGLSTAEGLINAVRDSRGEKYPGVDDKRLCAMMGELSETLTKMSRSGNTLSSTLKNAWDRKTLKVGTRTAPLKATGAMISVIGHITAADLPQLTPADLRNGFANRFLWICAKRSRSLSRGGNIDITTMPELVTKIGEALHWSAKQRRNIDFGIPAGKAWDGRYYEELMSSTNDDAGSATDRAVAQVRRLALIYAVADKSGKIMNVHLEAALEVWRYSEESAKYLFDNDGPKTTSQAVVVSILERRGGWVSQAQLGHATDKKKMTSYVVRSACEVLVKDELIEKREVPTGGRPRIEYRLK